MVILMRFSTGEDWNVYMYDYGNLEDCSVSKSFYFFINYNIID